MELAGHDVARLLLVLLEVRLLLEAPAAGAALEGPLVGVGAQVYLQVRLPLLREHLSTDRAGEHFLAGGRVLGPGEARGAEGGGGSGGGWGGGLVGPLVGREMRGAGARVRGPTAEGVRARAGGKIHQVTGI